MFWDMAQFINKSLVILCQTQADYTCCKDSSLNFSSEVYTTGTLFLSSKTFSVVIIIFLCLLAIKKT